FPQREGCVAGGCAAGGTSEGPPQLTEQGEQLQEPAGDASLARTSPTARLITGPARSRRPGSAHPKTERPYCFRCKAVAPSWRRMGAARSSRSRPLSPGELPAELPLRAVNPSTRWVGCEADEPEGGPAEGSEKSREAGLAGRETQGVLAVL